MENFKYVFKMHGATITNASKEDSIMKIEIKTDSISFNMLKSLEWIKGNDGGVYRLEVIGAYNTNEEKEIRLTLYYLDLNKVKVNRI